MSSDNYLAYKLIDSHHHLWDVEQHHYPWLAAKGEVRFFGQPDPIRKNYLVADYCSDHDNNISQSVHIQVGIDPALRLTETQWLQQCHDESNGKYPAKAVVEIDMLAADVEQQILAHKQFSITQGVRHIIGKSPEENKHMPAFNRDKWYDSLQLLVKHQLSFDLQLTQEHYEDVFNLLKMLPELKVVICHLASPWDQSEDGFDQWCTAMSCFAVLPNCYMKLSGFAMFNHGFKADKFKQYALKSIALFGVERCMLGSNFPVDKLYMSYQDLLACWHELLQSLPVEQQSYLAHKTAANFYGLTD